MSALQQLTWKRVRAPLFWLGTAVAALLRGGDGDPVVRGAFVTLLVSLALTSIPAVRVWVVRALSVGVAGCVLFSQFAKSSQAAGVWLAAAVVLGAGVWVAQWRLDAAERRQRTAQDRAIAETLDQIAADLAALRAPQPAPLANSRPRRREWAVAAVLGGLIGYRLGRRV